MQLQAVYLTTLTILAWLPSSQAHARICAYQKHETRDLQLFWFIMITCQSDRRQSLTKN